MLMLGLTMHAIASATVVMSGTPPKNVPGGEPGGDYAVRTHARHRCRYLGPAPDKILIAYARRRWPVMT